MPAGNVRRRRRSDDGGRVVPLPGQKKNKAKLKEFSFFQFVTTHPFQIVFGVFASIIIAGALTNRIIKAPINAVAFDLGETMPLEGVMAPNNRLSQAELILEDKAWGPESLALDEKHNILYAGFKSGIIAEITMRDGKEKITQAVRLAQGEVNRECDGSYDSMPLCGRPLGIRISKIGELIVADAYLGLFAINWEARQVVKILGAGELPSNDPNAPPVKYLNDLDILPDGRIIMSESSTKFDDRDFLFDVLEHRPNGRLLIYEPRKKNLRVLKDGLYFPNGVQVSIEKGSAKDAPWRVFYSEMSMCRVMQIWVPQDHYSTAPIKCEPLIENLPGYPDNIRLSKNGHLFVPIPSYRGGEDRFLEKSPAIREFITKIFSPQALSYAGNQIFNSAGLVLKVNTETGQVIESYSDQSGKVEAVSIAIDDGKGRMLIGSDSNYYIARAKL